MPFLVRLFRSGLLLPLFLSVACIGKADDDDDDDDDDSGGGGGTGDGGTSDGGFGDGGTGDGGTGDGGTGDGGTGDGGFGDGGTGDGGTSDGGFGDGGTGDGGFGDGGLAECPDEVPPAGSSDLDEACAGTATGAAVEAEVEWAVDSWSSADSYVHVMATPILASLTDDDADGDIDQDDVPDLIVTTYDYSDGVLRALSGDDGSTLFSTSPRDLLQGQSTVAVGDIDEDGIVEILAMSGDQVIAYEHTGVKKWTSESLDGNVSEYCDHISLGDMDGDGVPEIAVGNAILDADGELLAVGWAGIGGNPDNVGSTSVIADLDRDGTAELVTGNAAYDIAGDYVWANSQEDGYVAVGNFDRDDDGEVVVVGDGELRLQDSDGEVLWTYSPSVMVTGWGGPACIGDLDADGSTDIVFATGDRIYALDADGGEKWTAPISDEVSGNTGCSLFDFEGDGVLEVVQADSGTLWVFDGLDGAVELEWTEHSNATWMEYPIVADVDGDGEAEIALGHTGESGGRSGVTVLGAASGAWMPGRKIWNQYAYSGTNVDDDGGIPGSPAASWLEGDGFRTGELDRAGTAAGVDLFGEIVEVCLDECARDRISVQIQWGNQGHAASEGPVQLELLTISSVGSLRAWTATVDGDIAPGEVPAGMQVDLDLSSLSGPLLGLMLVVDSDFSVEECDEGDNFVTLKGDFCG